MDQPMQPTPPPSMPYPPPPQKKSGILKWVLIGCGAITVLGGLACAGCFGAVYYTIDKLSEEPGRVGEAYLRTQSDLETEVGKISAIKRRVWGSHVSISGSGGAARLVYAITSEKGTFSATVWLERKNSTWTAMGAEVTVGGKTWKVGVEVPMPKSSGSSWDD